MDWKTELLHIIKILKDNGVDVAKIQITNENANGKRGWVILKEIRQNGVDIEKIIAENQLDGNFKIGQKLHGFKCIYNGTREGKISEEQRKMAEEFGIVKVVPANRQKPLFKGRKISQFHVDIVRANIEKILTGEISNVDAIRLINEQALQCNETQLYDNGSIRRIVELVLDGKPEELKKYNEVLRENIGSRKEKNHEYVSTVINEYLPRYIRGEITFEEMEEELKTAHHTIDRIIIGHYNAVGDSEGLKQYETIKKCNSNRGCSIEKKKAAKEMREEIAKYDIVSDAEFLLLSDEEQDRQIIEKYRQEKVKQSISKESNFRISSEEFARNVVEVIKNYFRAKNDISKGIENFSEQDIRYIIFRFPTILGRAPQTLDEKLNVLTAYEEIDKQTACGMIKSFPAVIGYSPERLKAQLDLLQKENLIDAVISTPRRMMQSVNLMYALIEYAKQRHRTTDLSNVGRNNIFMASSTLKRLYGETYEELKARFPYEVSYNISGQDIGRATYENVSVTQADEAFNIVSQACNQELKKEVQ